MNAVVASLLRLVPVFALCVTVSMPAGARELKRLPSKTRNCQAEDLSGLRKLRAVYETPEAEVTQSFQKAPHQYMFFKPDQTFTEIGGSRSYNAITEMDEVLRESFQKDVRQYVLGENGAIYFYKDGAVTSSFICNIVRDKETGFKQGDMLFILTKPNSTDILVKVYSKHAFGKQKAPKLEKKEGKGKKDASKPAPKQPQKNYNPKKASEKRKARIQSEIGKAEAAANKTKKKK
jgi:hypothetical protein